MVERDKLVRSEEVHENELLLGLFDMVIYNDE